jgi:hypothetical protein
MADTATKLTDLANLLEIAQKAISAMKNDIADKLQTQLDAPVETVESSEEIAEVPVESNGEVVAEFEVSDEVDDSVYFEDVQNMNEFGAWIMRAWFNPERNSKSAWYAENLTQETVLDHILRNPKFPYSPSQLVEIWKAIPSIQRGLNSANSSDEISAVENTMGVYKKGEQTLSTIGAELGDVSATMVKKIGDGAEEKIKKFYGAKSPYDLSIEEEEEMINTVDQARSDAAVEFAATLVASAGNIKAFFDVLVKGQILSSNEVGLISAEEFQALYSLSMMNFETMDKETVEDLVANGYTIEDLIEEILVEDLEDDENVFKTFQNAVSKKVFPPGKRGRPKKVIEIADDA